HVGQNTGRMVSSPTPRPRTTSLLPATNHRLDGEARIRMETIVAFALPSRAYDLQMLDRPADRARDHGWVFGLPPGISSEQWPLDPVTGFPLMHGFTLKLPDDYRVHGEDIVAVSFFATAPDHNDGGAS